MIVKQTVRAFDDIADPLTKLDPQIRYGGGFNSLVQMLALLLHRPPSGQQLAGLSYGRLTCKSTHIGLECGVGWDLYCSRSGPHPIIARSHFCQPMHSYVKVRESGVFGGLPRNC